MTADVHCHHFAFRHILFLQQQFKGLKLFIFLQGAGHEVPRLQPAPALQMLNDFLVAVKNEHK